MTLDDDRDEPDDPCDDASHAERPGGDELRLGARPGWTPVFAEHDAGGPAAFSDRVPEHLRSARDDASDSGDDWAVAADGRRAWGRYGAAGLLAVDRARGVLLQHRARWNHHGGTWGIPGGALQRDERAVDGAMREAAEEADVPGDALDPLFTRVVDLGFWRYTTLAAVTTRRIRARVTDTESAGVAWVAPRELHRLRLHPGFGDAWPTLERLIRHRPALVVDGANVVGARPDGWWRDRAGAATRLLAGLGRLADEGVPAGLFGFDAELVWPDLLVVLEGRANAAATREGSPMSARRLAVVRSPGSGDDAIVEEVRLVLDADPERPVLVATSDRELRSRVERLGAVAVGAGEFRRVLDGVG